MLNAEQLRDWCNMLLCFCSADDPGSEDTGEQIQNSGNSSSH